MSNIFVEEKPEDLDYQRPITLTEAEALVKMFSGCSTMKVELGPNPSVNITDNLIILSEKVIRESPRYISVAHIVSMSTPLTYSYERDRDNLIFLSKLTSVSLKYSFVDKKYSSVNISYNRTYLPLKYALSFYERLEHSRVMKIARREIPGLPSSFLPHYSYQNGAFLSNSYRYAERIALTFLSNYLSEELCLDEFWDGWALVCSSYMEGLITDEQIMETSPLKRDFFNLLDELIDSEDPARSTDIICEVLDILSKFVGGRSQEVTASGQAMQCNGKGPLTDPMPFTSIARKPLEGEDLADSCETEEEGDPLDFSEEELKELYKMITLRSPDLHPGSDISHITTWADVKSISSHMIAPITIAMQRNLKDNHQADYDKGHKTGARIDGRSYIRGSISGTNNFFKRIDARGEKTYCIYLLFDISGSMGVGHADIGDFRHVFKTMNRTIASQQARLTVALVEALKSYPEIRVGLGVYHTDIFPLKSVRDRIMAPAIKQRVMDHILSPTGGNNDIEALLMAAKDTLSITAHKRLVIVVGDGEFCVGEGQYASAWSSINKRGVDVHVIATGPQENVEMARNFAPTEQVNTNVHHASDDNLGPIVGKICANWMR